MPDDLVQYRVSGLVNPSAHILWFTSSSGDEGDHTPNLGVNPRSQSIVERSTCSLLKKKGWQARRASNGRKPARFRKRPTRKFVNVSHEMFATLTTWTSQPVSSTKPHTEDNNKKSSSQRLRQRDVAAKVTEPRTYKSASRPVTKTS